MNISEKRIKGFTLIELIIVIAIIVILMGISSLVVQGFQRNARIETNNAKAQLVFTAFQDIVTECEIKHDMSMFDVRQELTNPSKPNISATGAVVFFRIAGKANSGISNVNGDLGIGDEIHIMTSYSETPVNVLAANIASGSIWVHGTTQNVPGYSGGYNSYLPDGGSDLWNRWEAAISGRLDETVSGTYAVMIDLENYEVKSVISRELENGADPKMGMFSENAFESSNPLYDFVPDLEKVNGSETLPIKMVFVKNLEQQRNIADGKRKDGTRGTGIYVGCYPFYDDLYTQGYPSVSNAS